MSKPFPTKKTKAQLTGAKSRAFGEWFETLTVVRLRHEGAVVERLRTMVSPGRAGQPARRVKVMGDIMGCTVDGRAVIVECKAHRDGKPPVPSDFKAHQIDSLRQWHRRGGLALVAYWDGSRCVMCPAVEVVGVV